MNSLQTTTIQSPKWKWIPFGDAKAHGGNFYPIVVLTNWRPGPFRRFMCWLLLNSTWERNT